MRLFLYEACCAGALGRTPSSLRVEGWAMLCALVADFERMPGIEVLTLLDGTCPQPLGRASRRTHAATELCAFEALARAADATLVIAPESNGVLADRSRRVLQAGGKLFGADPGAIDLTADKWALAHHWKRAGIPTPAVFPAADAHLLPYALYPLVCKPRHGAGSQATFLVSEPQHLDACLHQAGDEAPETEFVLQPFVHGSAASVTFLMGLGRAVPLVPARQILSSDGRFHYVGGDLPLAGPLAARAVKLATRAVQAVPGLAGFVGVDLVLGNAPAGGDFAIEINPRPTTSYVGLRRLAQGNLAEAMLHVIEGRASAELTWHPGRVAFSANGEYCFAEPS